jgi:RNA polymerase sigma-70 factor (ECF subfamily)
VQETLFEAHCGFAQFRGQTEVEFAAWLRRILANNLARAFERHVLAEKRDVHREVSMEEIGASLERSAARFQDIFVDQGATPGSAADRQERMLAVSAAMAKLPEDYRQVVIWRHLEGLAFADIAERLGKSAGACRMVWLRAIEQLRLALSREGWL